MGVVDLNNNNNNMYTKSNPKRIVKVKQQKVPWQEDGDTDSEYDINGAKVYRPQLPIRKSSSRRMNRRNRKKVGKTNLDPDYRVNMMSGNKSISDLRQEKIEKQMKDLKVDRHMKHLKLQRERSMKSYNSPTAIANRTLRKSLEWGGSMGDIAAIVYTDKLDTNDMGHLSHALRTQIKKERKLEKKEHLRKAKIEKAERFKHSLPYLLEPVHFDPIRQQDEALRHDVNLQRGYLHKLRNVLHHSINEENVGTVRKLFQSIDTKGRGVVSRKDFYKVLKHVSNKQIPMADIDKVVRHLPSRGVGEGIPYEHFTNQMLGKTERNKLSPYKVKWLADQGEFFEATSPKKNNYSPVTGRGIILPRLVSEQESDVRQMVNSMATGMKKSFSLPILNKSKTKNNAQHTIKHQEYLKSLKPLRFRAKPEENTAVLFEDVRYKNEKDRFANYRNKVFANRVNSKKTEGYRERFIQLEKQGQRTAILREKARVAAKYLRKEAYDKPIRERGAKEYEVSLKSGGGKKIVKTHFDHRKHQWKQQIGIKEYKEAMQRRGHNKLMMSPDYIRVFGVQPNMGWSIDRRRQGRGRDSTSKRLFG